MPRCAMSCLRRVSALNIEFYMNRVALFTRNQIDWVQWTELVVLMVATVKLGKEWKYIEGYIKQSCFNSKRTEIDKL